MKCIYLSFLIKKRHIVEKTKGVFENGCICIYIGALGSVSVMGKKYVLAL